jgi:hypothetical protein
MIAWLYPVALLQATASEAPPAPPPPTCESKAHTAFDFWVGEWDVYPAGSSDSIAESRIEHVSGGCVIRESWMPLSRGDVAGTSISFINHLSGRWEQVWVGSDGRRVDFAGGVVAGEMVLTGYWDGIGTGGQAMLTRMTYSKEADGSVRQHGEGSTDHGKTWQTTFDLIYRAKDSQAP